MQKTMTVFCVPHAVWLFSGGACATYKVDPNLSRLSSSHKCCFFFVCRQQRSLHRTLSHFMFLGAVCPLWCRTIQITIRHTLKDRLLAERIWK